MCVKVEVGVCIALRGEVGSKEGPVVLVELFRSWVDGYGPEVLLLFFTWVRKSGSFSYISIKLFFWLIVKCWFQGRISKCLKAFH